MEGPQEGFEVLVVAAAGDGVAPCVLLSTPQGGTKGSKGRQYLFNVPEGFSRLALEHKVRPTGRLAAVFATGTTSGCTGGLVGLMYRLSADGHGEVSVVGPRGTVAGVHAMRHFVRWRHPKLYARDHEGAGSPLVYMDSQVVVAAVPWEHSTWEDPWVESLGKRLWSGGEGGQGEGKKARGDRESSSSEEEESSSSEEEESSSSEDESSSSEEAGAASPGAGGGCCDGDGCGGESRETVFQALDALFAAGPGGRGGRGRGGGRGGRGGGAGQVLGGRGGQLLGRAAAAPKAAPTGARAATGAGRQGGAAGGSAGAGAGASRAEGRTPASKPAGDKAGKGKPDAPPPPSDPFVLLPAERGFGVSNPVYVEPSVAQAPLPAPGGALLGYLCYLRPARAAVAVVNCPPGGGAGALCGHPAFAALREGRIRCAAVVHLAPPAVVASESYQRWMEEVETWVGPGGEPPVQVVVGCGGGGEAGAAVGGCGGELGHLATLRTLGKLNLVSPALFPLPPPAPAPAPVAAASALTRAVHATLLTRVTITARAGAGGGAGGGDGEAEAEAEVEVGVDRAGCPEAFDVGALHREVAEGRPLLGGLIEALPLAVSGRAQHPARAAGTAAEAPPALASTPAPASNKAGAAALRAKLMGGKAGADATPDAAPTPAAPLPAPLSPIPLPVPRAQQPLMHPEVVFLGTGSAEPSKYRGASAIHLRLPGGSGLLMDAGEGALGAMQRRYGAALGAQLLGLQAVWISHKHADHCAGLRAIVEARPPGAGPLLIVGPTAVQKWLGEVMPAGPYVFSHCLSFDSDPRCAPLRFPLIASLGLVLWHSVPVDHCPDAYGLVLAHRAGWKMCYSGDTRPCPRLAQAAAGCTLLVHEATFEAALQDHAVRKRHSTAEEALEVAQRMGAHRVVLTHFSQRYPKLVEFDGAGAGGGAGGGAGRAGVAYDGMVVPFEFLEALPEVLGAVRCVLEAEADEGEGEGEREGEGA